MIMSKRERDEDEEERGGLADVDDVGGGGDCDVMGVDCSIRVILSRPNKPMTKVVRRASKVNYIELESSRLTYTL